MTEEPEKEAKKPIPAAILTAQDALKILRAEDAVLEQSVQKILPALAMKLDRAGEEVTKDILLAHARQGVDYLSSLQANTLQQKLLTYAEVAAGLKKPEAAEEGEARGNEKKVNKKPLYAQLRAAAAAGDIEKVREILDSRLLAPSEENMPFTDAAYHGHIDIVRLFLQRGVKGNIDRSKAFRWASISQHYNTEVARLLLDEGADVHADSDQALRLTNHVEIARLLLARGADVHACGDEALIRVATEGLTEMARLLLEHGADVHAKNDMALRKAARHQHSETACFLIEKGAPLTILTKKQKELYTQYCQVRENWLKTVRCPPPDYLDKKNPVYFKSTAFAAIKKILLQERCDDRSAAQMAFSATALFGTEQRVLQYLEKWGCAGKQPLHDVIYFINAPKEDGVDIKAWGDAVFKCGSGMGKLFSWADKMPRPEKSSDSKTWSYQNTRAKISQFAYQRAGEHPELAMLCFEHMMTEESFDAALKIVKKKKKNLTKNLPDTVVDGTEFGMEGATFHRLAADDLRGLILGELVDNCQSVGGLGAECAEHGFTSKNGGFYVVEKNDEILGETWAWRGKKGELVFDSLETLGGRVTPDQWKNLTVAFSKALKKNPGKVTALHIGTGGKTPGTLVRAFKKTAIAEPLDYKGLCRDSHDQIVVWKKSGR